MSSLVGERRRAAAGTLGPLPASVTRLLAVTAAPDYDLGEVVDIVAHDMVLTGAVLRMANSAASAPSQPIHTVHQAVVRLGAATTIAAAMHNVVGGALHGDLRRYGLGASALWTHSCAASIAADCIRRSSQLSLPTSISTTALLHDIGKVVLDRLVVDEPDDESCGALDDAIEGDLCAAERERFGIDHAEMGALTAELWNLPPAIVEGIAGHHRLFDDPLPSAICLADHVAHLACADLSRPALDDVNGAAQSAAAILGVGAADLDAAVEVTRLQLADLTARFSVSRR